MIIEGSIIVVYKHSRGGNLAAIVVSDIQDSIEGFIILRAIRIGQICLNRRKKSVVFLWNKKLDQDLKY